MKSEEYAEILVPRLPGQTLINNARNVPGDKESSNIGRSMSPEMDLMVNKQISIFDNKKPEITA